MNWLSLLITKLKSMGLTEDELLLFVLIIAGVIWLYREVSRNIASDNSATLSRFEKKLELYGVLQITMSYYIRDETEESERRLLEAIGKTYAYLSPKIFDRLFTFRKSPNRAIIRECLHLVEEEISNLRVEYEAKLPFVEQGCSLAKRNTMAGYLKG